MIKALIVEFSMLVENTVSTLVTALTLISEGSPVAKAPTIMSWERVHWSLGTSMGAMGSKIGLGSGAIPKQF